VFAPDIALPALHRMVARASGSATRAAHASGVNVTAGIDAPWVSEGVFGLDQGLMVLMIENFRTGLPWCLTRSIPCLRDGLTRAGFTGGWL